MKLQKLTEKRWFWPLVCAVSVVFGWWYLSIVTCAPLGGDDELINLQNYYYITHTSFGQSVLDYIGDLWTQFSLQQGRFQPQQKAGHRLYLPAAHDVQCLAGLHRQQPVFLRCAGAKYAAARTGGRAGCAAFAGYRAQAVGRVGGVLRVPVLCHV